MNEYYLGLDMGTNSVGWAVTNTEYELIRKKGKDLWGIREFDKADSAIERRSNRISRRRRQKETVRMGIIRSYFDEEISKVDPAFFLRLDNSKYHIADKDENVRYKYGIFNDDSYSDVDYYRDYPTIFHLRKELIENSQKHDIRLIYLAIANMFKHRGHFLNESLSTSDANIDVQVLYDEIVNIVEKVSVSEDSDAGVVLPAVNAGLIIEILEAKDCSRTVKAEKLCQLLNINKQDKQAVEYLRTLCGLKVDCKKLFPTLESDEKIELCFADFGYEDKIPEISTALGEERYEAIEMMKQMYDAGILAGILKGSQYISVSRVHEYEKHKKDLEILKKVIRDNKSLEDYNYLFRSEESGTYSAYVNTFNSNGEKRRRDMKGRKTEDLYKTISHMLKGVEGEQAEYILAEIRNENFLPKQLTNANGVIPNQVHAIELRKILKNAEEHYDFLKSIDESGLTVSERIEKLFSFHVPYYIGPVSENSEKNKGNGWVIRREEGQVLPWNYAKKIDVDKTSIRFIERMLRECTYLRGEKVLPKNSLMYEKFSVLNEINNLKIDGDKIDVELKQSIYNDLFKSGKRVTRKQLEKYLNTRGYIQHSSQLTGIDTNINNALTTYGKFKAIFGDELDKDSISEMVENIVFLCTIYGDSKKILIDNIAREYGDRLNENQIKRIVGYKFNDWGKLSKELLEMRGVDKETGEEISLIRALWESNNNLMELLYSDAYTFKDELENRKTAVVHTLKEFEYEDLDDYYFSAAVKRMVWQTILIIKEVSKIMGNEPTRMFIEMTRTEEEKGDAGRKNSRKKQLLELYKNVNDNLQDWNSLIESSDASGRLKSKKMYLYLTQMGRDMYTGKPIDLDRLFDDNLYDIDHIYPRSFVKDDNLNNNLVLVNKPDNSRKSNSYPLDETIVKNEEVVGLWKRLHEAKLINDEKYSRLTSRKAFSDEQKAGFIARQLVETSQATKGVADIIKGICPNTELIYSKAGNVSDFRRDYKLYKTRSINEHHHANDAYLNIVVGNAYWVKFTNNPINFIKKEYMIDPKKYEYHLGKMFSKDIKRGEITGWIASKKDGETGTIQTVRKVLAKNTPLMTRMVTSSHGALYNVNPISSRKAKADNYVPLKTSDAKMADVTKYGGYNSINPGSFVFIEYGKKKRKKAFDVIPQYRLKDIKTNEDIVRYFEDECGYEDVAVKYSDIKKETLLKIDGFLMYIVGMDSRKNVELHNAVNMIVGGELYKYVHSIDKTIREGQLSNDITEEMNMKLYEYLKEKYTAGIFSHYPKDIASILEKGIEKFRLLSLDKQVAVLGNIMMISSINGKVTELSSIGGPSSDVGRIRISGNMTDKKEVLIINQSVTGVYEKYVNLLEL